MKTELKAIGFCFMFAACLRFFMPDKNIVNSSLFLGIGICMILISMATQNTSKENQDG